MHRIAAGLVAGGTFLCVVATPLLLASAYAKVMSYIDALLALSSADPTYVASAVDDGLAWAGWLCLGIGAAMLSAGLYRVIAHRHANAPEPATTEPAGP